MAGPVLNKHGAELKNRHFLGAVPGVTVLPSAPLSLTVKNLHTMKLVLQNDAAVLGLLFS